MILKEILFMKRIFIFILTTLLLFTLVACKTNKTDETSDNSENSNHIDSSSPDDSADTNNPIDDNSLYDITDVNYMREKADKIEELGNMTVYHVNGTSFNLSGHYSYYVSSDNSVISDFKVDDAFRVKSEHDSNGKDITDMDALSEQYATFDSRYSQWFYALAPDDINFYAVHTNGDTILVSNDFPSAQTIVEGFHSDETISYYMLVSCIDDTYYYMTFTMTGHYSFSLSISK